MDIIFHALRRRAKRFAALVARIEAGLPLPSPRHRPPAAADAVYQRVRPTPDLAPPRSRAWLLKMLQHRGAHWYWQLQQLLAEPEMAALIAADPRVGRLLRPLWRMLGAHAMPDVLRPPLGPPRPRAPRVARAVQPPPPVVPAPPPARVTRVPYIIGFGPAFSE